MMRFLIILFLTCACVQTQAQVNIITTIAGNDTSGFKGDGGQALFAQFDHANQLCVDKFGNLYISDAFNNRIRKIVLSTGIITTIAGNGTGGYNGDGIQATNAELFIPEAVCTDTLGNIYIGDAFNNRIRKVTVSSGVITTFVGTGTPGNSGDGGMATDAQIMTPAGLTMDALGNLFLTDIDNNNVRKIAPDGTITTVAGNGTIGYSGDGGIATGAQLSSPGDVAVDSSGNIIISDTYNNVIRKINASTGIINTIAGNGTAGYFGDNGPALNSKLNFPYGVYVDKQDNIFIAERLNGVIRKIDGSTGIITTAVGCGIEGFSGDGGPTTDAKLRPDDVFFDENGTMYIADYGNNRIRAVYNSKLGVTNIKLTNDVLIYPNPAQNEVIIENAEGSGVKIYNLLGQEELNAKNISNKEVVNIQGLIPGIYVVQIIGANGEVQNKRVIKE